jgi:hypothetical protein
VADSQDSAVTGIATVTVSLPSTAVAVSTSTDPSVSGQKVTITATVMDLSPASGTPTGTVTFMDGATTLGMVVLTGGKATLIRYALIAGSHAISVSFAGNANFQGSASVILTQTVNPDSTTISVVSSVQPSVYGQEVIFSATVNPTSPGSGVPTGTMTFMDGTITLGTAVFSFGIATLTRFALNAGSHAISVKYGGDANFSASSSATLTQSISTSGTSTFVTSSANPSLFGQAVTFTATMSPIMPGTGKPTGLVIFEDGSTTLGTAIVHSGNATFAISSLALGAHSLTAFYSGDANFRSSNSAKLTQTVQPAGSHTSAGSAAR